jgi:hypothetical protein
VEGLPVASGGEGEDVVGSGNRGYESSEGPFVTNSSDAEVIRSHDEVPLVVLVSSSDRLEAGLLGEAIDNSMDVAILVFLSRVMGSTFVLAMPERMRRLR